MDVLEKAVLGPVWQPDNPALADASLLFIPVGRVIAIGEGISGLVESNLPQTDGAQSALQTAELAKLLLGSKSAIFSKILQSTAANSGLHVASGMGGEVLPMQIVKILPKGTAGGLINEAKALTFSTGNEHALVRLATGERALVSGGPGGISFAEGQVTRIIGQTHPFGTASVGASIGDRAALQTLGQTHSYIVEGGKILRFGPTPK